MRQEFNVRGRRHVTHDRFNLHLPPDKYSAPSGSIDTFSLGTEVLAGIALGVGVPFVAIRLEQSRFFEAAIAYEPSTRSPSGSSSHG